MDLKLRIAENELSDDDTITDEELRLSKNDDAQDLQASTFRVGVAKTQQQLMLENPHMNGDMYAEGTIDEEELDENGNGIPDNEEDLVGTFLRPVLEAFAEQLRSTEVFQSEIENAFSAADRDITSVGSHLHHAVVYVQQHASTDPQAQGLLDNYNKATDEVQSALSASRQSQSAGNFVNLKIAELDRSIAKADIVKYESGAHGETDELARAEKWHDAAQAIRDKLAEIQKLPPDQQQAAMDKFAQENPNARMAREWEKFKAGDLSKWARQDNRHLAAGSPDYTQSNSYSRSRTSSTSNSSWSLSSIFGNWAMPWSSPTPAKSQTVSTQAPSTDASKTANNSWSLSSIFGKWSWPWEHSSPVPAPNDNTQKAVASFLPTFSV